MYYLKKKSLLTNITLRGIFLSKKYNKIQKKQIMVFLRAPKHFNIGKHKIKSFNNKHNITYNTHIFLLINFFTKNSSLMYKLFTNTHKFNNLYKINSIKTTIKVKIKW